MPEYKKFLVLHFLKKCLANQVYFWEAMLTSFWLLLLYLIDRICFNFKEKKTWFLQWWLSVNKREKMGKMPTETVICFQALQLKLEPLTETSDTTRFSSNTQLVLDCSVFTLSPVVFCKPSLHSSNAKTQLCKQQQWPVVIMRWL